MKLKALPRARQVYQSPDTAPLAYLDLIAAFGIMNGAIQIEHAGRRLDTEAPRDECG
jgi:hypothetical protein